jgi:hypothetical protein
VEGGISQMKFVRLCPILVAEKDAKDFHGFCSSQCFKYKKHIIEKVCREVFFFQRSSINQYKLTSELQFVDFGSVIGHKTVLCDVMMRAEFVLQTF